MRVPFGSELERLAVPEETQTEIAALVDARMRAVAAQGLIEAGNPDFAIVTP